MIGFASVQVPFDALWQIEKTTTKKDWQGSPRVVKEKDTKVIHC